MNSLKSTIDYILQDKKTDNSLISTYDCNRFVILEDFHEVYDNRKKYMRKDTKNKAKMIIQSFSNGDNINPEKAHQIGKEFSESYLEGKHKYIVVTHLDSSNIHNHIVFNEVETESLKMFDTTRENTLNKLRRVNDTLSEKYNLTIPENKQNLNKVNYMRHGEVQARLKGRSIKAKLEELIDQAIKASGSYQEFLNYMEENGYEYKPGRHLGFKSKETTNFMRTKTLGFNYTKNSIEYRIKNKDFDMAENPYTVKTAMIDKSQHKYKENYGLRQWASKQNIIHLQELSDLVINQKKSLKEIEGITMTEKEVYGAIESQIDHLDDVLHDLDKKKEGYSTYKSLSHLIKEFKSCVDPKGFKPQHTQDFIRWDKATKDIRTIKNQYKLDSLEEVNEYQARLKVERDILYRDYSTMTKSTIKDKRRKRTRSL